MISIEDSRLKMVSSLTKNAYQSQLLLVVLLASVVMNTRLNAVVYPQNGELKNSEIEKLLFQLSVQS